MATIIVKHSVEDFDAWKPYYDDHEDTRREYGLQEARLFRLADDPNEIVMVAEWDTAENAQKFVEESDLKDVMAEAGVVGEPEIMFLDEIEAARGTPAA
ncbi:antibiotic biosynthesis monooxygenase [Halorarius litoreus]|uniref:antibiotic biosynthesis monooxygenase n=1 Tax=Halorarius litoreus TaxID=2962676 RepID=UPI0020CBF7C4|nr:antibiotic biosynthesis monooxygenase [Halorarius litoreus]